METRLYCANLKAIRYKSTSLKRIVADKSHRVIVALEMYQMKRFIDMEHCLPVCFCFYQLGLCSVSYTANEYSICHFSIIIKDFFISFLRVIIIQDFETVTFYVLFAYKPTFSVIFC